MLLELPVIDSADAYGEKPQEKLWRSLSHLENSPEYQQFAGNEFGPEETTAAGGASRRQFLQLMGASMALAGLTACRRPVQHILPYSRKPEEVIPGVSLFYATSMPMGASIRPLLVETHEGRPTKVEGNPDHPMSRGATGPFEQASVLNLYDPHRSKRVRFDGRESSWQEFVRFARQLAPAAGRVAVVAEASSSPTFDRIRQAFQERFPGSPWITYSALGDDHAGLGMQEVEGRPVRPMLQLSGASVIVSFDADFLGPTDPNHVMNVRNFAATRRMLTPQSEMSRLYVVESNYTTTGGMADHRLRLRSSDIADFASAVAGRLGAGGETTNRFANHPWIDALAADLQANRGRCVVVAGEAQPAAVHALCARINQALGNNGSTVLLLDTGEADARRQTDDLQNLAAALRAGTVDTLLILGANPVYSAPARLRLEEALRGTENTIHVGEWIDETARACRWHIPRSHFMEAWGDGRAYDGTLGVIQPLIAPLYESKSDVEVLNLLATGLDQDGYDLVRQTWQDLIAGEFEQGWSRVLHDGFLENSQFTGAMAAVAPEEVQEEVQEEPQVTPPPVNAVTPNVPPLQEGQLEVVFRLHPSLHDGRFANNAWMQELPDPVTKIVWDNVAIMSPHTADRLGLTAVYSKGRYFVDIIELTVDGETAEVPVWPLPGHADDSITVSIGHGRQIESDHPVSRPAFFSYVDVYRTGPLANEVGSRVAHLLPATGGRVVTGVSVRRTGRTHMIATTQDHHLMLDRPVVIKGTVDEFRSHPTFARDRVGVIPGADSWQEYPTGWSDRKDSWEEEATRAQPYYEQQWGMSIDLNTCTGCNTCIVACNSENNVQVVGKDQVSRGREMHWLRLDRYFVGDDMDNPELVFQPMMCVHCEYAPCEQVCPVNATSHSADGINEMTYNRCIGTRYCANNCPYKVRRFNYYSWVREMPTQVQMAQNPNVTVRFRGVMEKCTYCVQRVREVGRNARIQNREIQDGEVLTACQQVCPAQAITFGDITDPYSVVSQLKRSDRSYDLLPELNTKPRTSYMARLRNPNPRLEANS